MEHDRDRLMIILNNSISSIIVILRSFCSGSFSELPKVTLLTTDLVVCYTQSLQIQKKRVHIITKIYIVYTLFISRRALTHIYVS